MSGLTGEITFDGSPADVAAVGRMVEAVVPRGPDGQGAWNAGRVAFGHHEPQPTAQRFVDLLFPETRTPDGAFGTESS